jgi:hypothetical protein
MIWLLKVAARKMAWREIGPMFGVCGEAARRAAQAVDRGIAGTIERSTIERSTDPPWLRRLREAGAIGTGEHEWRGATAQDSTFERVVPLEIGKSK